MSCGKFEAARKFWELPELVEKLLPFLDLESTLHLAQAHQLTRDILQRSFTWDKLIGRSCLQEEAYHCLDDGLFKEKVASVKLLVAILKLMKDPKANMLDLLDTICKMCPPDVLSRFLGTVQIVSPTHPDSYEVFLSDFLLLEEVEGGLESAEQQVKTVFLRHLWGPWFSPLESRARRQQRSVNQVEADEFAFEEEEDMEKLLSLQQNCQKLTFGEAVVVPGLDGKGGVAGYGQDFWAQMARSLKLGNLVIDTVGTTRNYLLQGRREDLRAIWDAQVPDAGGCSFFIVYNGPFPVLWWTSEEEKEKAWMDFQLILDTKPQQWPERLKQQLELSEEEDSSDGSEAS